MATSPAADGPPRELVDRFAAALERLNPGGERIGLAVSGGPDSMAMLLLAHAAIPGMFEVATVDHGLRSEAKDECALVDAACAERGIPCAVLTVEVGEGNLQEQARIARYSALGKWAARRDVGAVATAHHADDQAETLLMRLNRGSGVGGLAGVRESEAFPEFTLRLVRPLLDFRRRELAVVVAAIGQQAASDPSNSDDRFDRVRMRKALAEAEWIDPAAVARSARHLADAEEAVEQYFHELLERDAYADSGEAGFRDPQTRQMQFLLSQWAISEIGGMPRGEDVARLVERLRSGGTGNVAGVLATVEGDEWVFRPEPPRRTG